MCSIAELIKKCATTTPGLIPCIFLAPAEAVLIPPTFTELDENDDEPGQDVTLSGPITAANPGEGYVKIPIIDGTGGLKQALEGTRGTGYTFKGMLEYQLRGLSPEVLSHVKRLVQCCEGFTALAPCKDKQGFYQIGDECSPLIIEPGDILDTGKTSGDFKGVTIQLSAIENCPVRIYDADTLGIPLAA